MTRPDALARAAKALRRARYELHGCYVSPQRTEYIAEALAAIEAEQARIPEDREWLAKIEALLDEAKGREDSRYLHEFGKVCRDDILPTLIAALRIPAPAEVDGHIDSLTQMARWVRQAQDGVIPVNENVSIRITIDDIDADEIEAAAALLRRLSPVTGAGEWRPIETALSDQMLWTLWDGVNTRTKEPARYYHAAALIDGEWRDDEDEAIDEPTHWMPLPAPPLPETEGKP